jgi:hypothetical protein
MFTHLNFQRKFWRARNENLKFKIFRYEKETTEKSKEIYSSRKGTDSPGGFGPERARKINPRIISKNCTRKALARPFGLAKCERAHANK